MKPSRGVPCVSVWQPDHQPHAEHGRQGCLRPTQCRAGALVLWSPHSLAREHRSSEPRAGRPRMTSRPPPDPGLCCGLLPRTVHRNRAALCGTCQVAGGHGVGVPSPSPGGRRTAHAGMTMDHHWMPTSLQLVRLRVCLSCTETCHFECREWGREGGAGVKAMTLIPRADIDGEVIDIGRGDWRGVREEPQTGMGEIIGSRGPEGEAEVASSGPQRQPRSQRSSGCRWRHLPYQVQQPSREEVQGANTPAVLCSCSDFPPPPGLESGGLSRRVGSLEEVGARRAGHVSAEAERGEEKSQHNPKAHLIHSSCCWNVGGGN